MLNFLISKKLSSGFILGSIVLIVLILFYWEFSLNPYQIFSDAAKFSNIARQLIAGRGYVTDFSFFSEDVSRYGLPIRAYWIPPIMPLAIAGFFEIFGISDLSVIATSATFHLFLVLTTYFLGKKLWGRLVGILGALVVAFNVNFLEYAVTGASETLFTFEMILAVYLFILRKKWGNILGFVTLVALYFTRPQAFIYIAGLILFWLLLRFPVKKAVLYFVGLTGLGILIDLFLLTPLAGKFFLYSIVGRGINAVTQYLPGAASSDVLRGFVQDASVLAVFKKVFYNLYNFYRLLPQIASPYMWALFAIGLFKWGKDRVENSLKVATIFMVFLTFLVTALTIPLFRYLHPVVPLVYLLATATLVWIIRQIIKDGKKVAIISLVLIFLFVVGQTLGVIFLDSRFKAKTVNKGKPPIYVQFSWILRDNTRPEDVIVTNLDTWGSWYGERRTVWYPLKPEQLDLKGAENPFDAIFLTSYLIDDENYYMGPEWRQIFENPRDIKDKFIAKNYKFAGEFKVSADENYEKQEGRAILLVRK